MLSTRQIAVVAVFSAVIVSSNFALTDLLNVKLMDTLVFVAAFVYGFRTGALVGITSELVWGVASPYGFGAYIIPFLVLGEVLYAAAGSIAASVWKEQVRSFSANNLAIGSIMTITAFIWDFETNIGTALIAFWPNVTLAKILTTEFVTGGLFMVFHELSDFLLGFSIAPIMIVYLLRLRGSPVRLARKEVLAEVRN